MSRFQIFEGEAKSILSKTSGFISQAGFTHSLSPARNCTYGCTYCYVPTMRIQGGLQRADWERWGQFTTFKSNAAALLAKQLRGSEIIYCSPLVDPYQPAEAAAHIMPQLLTALLKRPPAAFVIQTRGPLILRDLALLAALSRLCRVRVSFSLTTDDDSVRARFEPHCEPIATRLHAILQLRSSGIETFATLAPLLPCDPERLAQIALAATDRDIIGDPLHVRSVKPQGATTRAAARKIAQCHNEEQWFEASHQSQIARRIQQVVNNAGRRFATGVEAFAWLAQ